MDRVYDILHPMWFLLRIRIQQWWCRKRGHRSIAREWEWSVSDPLWKEREVWSCVACHEELGTDPPMQYPRIRTYRPIISDELWQLAKHLKTNSEFADIRLRAVGRTMK